MNRFRSFARKPPGVDSARAIASAQLYLVGARSIDIDAATLARRYNLSLKRAEYMLTMARNHRERAGG